MSFPMYFPLCVFWAGVFLDAEFTAPWCAGSQVGPEEFQAQGRIPAHLIAYHYIVDGRLFVRVADTPALEAQAGEIVLLPLNDRHVLGSAPGLRPEVIDNLVEGPSERGPASLRFGGGGEPPMHYLASWRLQLAAVRLRESIAAAARIASEVGYESDAAFNRAFKRAFATTPAAWRRPGQLPN